MTSKQCDYYKCEENAVWLTGEGNPGWNLCQGHLDEMDEIIADKENGPKRMLGWWARGKSPEAKDKMAKQIAEGAGKLFGILKDMRKKGGK